MMTAVNKISEIKSAGRYSYNGAVINVTEVTENGRLRGTCVLATGKEFNFSNSCSGLKARIENDGINPSGKTSSGKTSKVTIPAKVDNSQASDYNKVIASYQSASKRQKRFLKAYKLCKQASEVYGLTDVFSGILEQLQELDNYTRHCEEVKAQQLRDKIKAEAEAKKQAEEEEAKKRQTAEQIINEYNTLCKFMPDVQAASVLVQTYGADIVNSVLTH